MDRFRLSLSASIALLSLSHFTAGAATITSTTTAGIDLPPEAIGYYIHDSLGTVTGAYGYCCHPSRTESCALATECRDGTIKGPDHTSSCENCVTVSVYESIRLVPPSVKFVQCLSNWPALTLYRHLPSRKTTSIGITSMPHNATITTSPDVTTTSTSSIKSPGSITAAPIAPSGPNTPTSSPGDLSDKSPDEKKSEAAKISSIIIGIILFIAIVILGLLLGRSKWNKPASQDSLSKLHEAEGSNGLVPAPTRRITSRRGSQRSHTSRDGFISFEDLSPSCRYSPAQELPTVVEERYQQLSTTSSPISPCLLSIYTVCLPFPQQFDNIGNIWLLIRSGQAQWDIPSLFYSNIRDNPHNPFPDFTTRLCCIRRLYRATVDTVDSSQWTRTDGLAKSLLGVQPRLRNGIERTSSQAAGC
ncbi:predicted protein [Histoplasma capsulatum G186AR]|uniref:Uncharacterized protein n=1 Tax=Ajellomyces capsulatus (strain G186AR / H82 / ATCC MYA-2454 / RMSCC 2432) TaxID=447093 RepID=C0NIU0_AJECG|nr:uncharacterized protein HCBG_02347 [Histoplasma capsulatum G186AR]EEH08810.1 predicted protein [Histoplasma capsulatum G186AR]